MKKRREIEPYFVTFKWSEWYVFGYCKLRQDFKLFKLNRISHLKTINNQFTRRDIPREKLDFNIYFQSEQKTITILIDRSVEYQIVDSYGADSYEITEDNRIKFHLVYTNHHYAMDFIQSLGDKAYVISSQSIIDELKANAQNILKMYK
ncbi:helix-turn-helix transcriptional regulator [Alkaliphilus peptidifermentans]|uniref:WYL domain-containing protein n=1 Tax=Alkaliphilus peptidifermentans DSM 18978 TaxID=1120976 RepID=A0A1G5BT65_9FIRM|nr:WYL domain-containing protein [Alkaliphilus peptidifermentans]SCX93244.1 WYL domain-containing protein [Alkaliphilus peptidifermentans DSM 18978]